MLYSSALAGMAAAGCGSGLSTPRVVYLEGAGWAGSAGSVRSGLRAARYNGAFETFTWTSVLGAPADHLLAARSRIKAKRLARRIEKIRRHNPEGKIYVMGLSAGTALIVKALEELPDGVEVDHVVLFSSSMSARYNLVEALEHVRGRLYATCSGEDMILASLAVNADGMTGQAAGQNGFVLPEGLSSKHKRSYAKVVNLPWRAAYAGFGWNGGHVRATTARFVRGVIAPRILPERPFPLDRPMVRITSKQ
ncbi:MAG: hypothetical protein ACYSUQ_09315 [Planctomycetota bacterium]|jgi:pimeloyl-ACP methyl ester carboxylesterase